MAASWATEAEYVTGFGAPPEAIKHRLPEMLARASRRLHAEAALSGVDIDARIAEGALEASLVADIVCQMVEEAGQVPGGMGVSQMSQNDGPFGYSLSYTNPAGRLYVGKDAKRLLGIGTQSAFTVSMTPDPGPGPLDWLAP